MWHGYAAVWWWAGWDWSWRILQGEGICWYETADADVQLSTFSSRIDHGPASPAQIALRCYKYVNMLTWKDHLFPSKCAVPGSARQWRAEENSSRIPYKGLFWYPHQLPITSLNWVSLTSILVCSEHRHNLCPHQIHCVTHHQGPN